MELLLMILIGVVVLMGIINAFLMWGLSLMIKENSQMIVNLHIFLDRYFKNTLDGLLQDIEMAINKDENEEE